MPSPLPRLSFPRVVLSPLGAVLAAALVTTAPARASLVVEATPASPAQDDAAARDAFRSTVFLPTVAEALTPVSGDVVFSASDPHVRTSTAVACVQMLSACTRVLLPAPCVAWNPQHDPPLDPELVAFLTGDADAAIEQEAIDAALQELDARSEGFWGLTAEIGASGDDAGLPRKNAWNARGRASERAAIAAARSARDGRGAGGGGRGGGGGAGGRGPRGFRTAQTAASVENGSADEPASLGASSPQNGGPQNGGPQNGGTTGSGGSGLADLGVVPPANNWTNPGGSVLEPGGSFSSSSSYTPPSASNTGTGSVSVNPEPVSAGLWALLAAAAACGARGRRCRAA